MGKLRKIIGRFIKILAIICATCVSLPVFVCDRFVVKGVSMRPTYGTGDILWVNKLYMGARIYTGYDFKSPRLKCFRLPGIRKIKVRDVVVFNAPFGWGGDKLGFRINNVYAKRCLGCPGDTIGIKDCFFYNERERGGIGNLLNQQDLKNTPDSSLQDYAFAAYPYSSLFNWTIKNLGPIVIPYKGMHAKLDEKSFALYSTIIEYENAVKPCWQGGKCIMGRDVCEEYVFKQNYYYFVGDNVLDSKDSRYFGFVPERFVVGIVVN